MNRELIYDLGKFLKKCNPSDIAELISILNEKEKLDKLILSLRSLEIAAKAMQKDKQQHKSKKQIPTPVRRLNSISNALQSSRDK